MREHEIFTEEIHTKKRRREWGVGNRDKTTRYAYIHKPHSPSPTPYSPLNPKLDPQN
jgi:hypothetical protein